MLVIKLRLFNKQNTLNDVIKNKDIYVIYKLNVKNK